MTGKIFVLVAALLTGLCKVAAAAEPPEHTSKRAHKVLTVLASVGVNDPVVTRLVNETSGYVSGGYVRLSEERMGNGTLTLQYELSTDVGAKQIELRYTPDDSDMYYTARPNAVMVNYSFKF